MVTHQVTATEQGMEPGITASQPAAKVRNMKLF